MIAVRNLYNIVDTIFTVLDEGILNRNVIVRGKIEIISREYHRQNIIDYINDNLDVRNMDMFTYKSTTYVSVIKRINVIPTKNITIEYADIHNIRNEGVYIIYDPDNNIVNCDYANEITSNIFCGYEDTIFIKLHKNNLQMDCCICGTSRRKEDICQYCNYKLSSFSSSFSCKIDS